MPLGSCLEDNWIIQFQVNKWLILQNFTGDRDDKTHLDWLGLPLSVKLDLAIFSPEMFYPQKPLPQVRWFYLTVEQASRVLCLSTVPHLSFLVTRKTGVFSHRSLINNSCSSEIHGNAKNHRLFPNLLGPHVSGKNHTRPQCRLTKITHKNLPCCFAVCLFWFE